MPYCKTSLTLDPKLVKECQKIAFKNDVSFSRFMRDLMRKAVKTQQRSNQRSQCGATAGAKPAKASRQLAATK